MCEVYGFDLLFFIGGFLYSYSENFVDGVRYFMKFVGCKEFYGLFECLYDGYCGYMM